MNRFTVSSVLLSVLFIVLILGTSTTRADEPNVGILRVAEVKHPRQVAPSAVFSFLIDVRYAIRFNATIKSAVFEGSPSSLGGELWHSDPIGIAAGGDKLWTVSLRAPTTERNWSLTVFAYFLEEGEWRYYKDSVHGPGFAQLTVKVATLATLEIDLGIPDLPVMLDNSTRNTPFDGRINVQLPVGARHEVEIPTSLELKNSTRLVFSRWQDGSNQTRRVILFDGDAKLTGIYKRQYLLRVESIVSTYSFSKWYDARSNVTLSAARSVPLGFPFGFLGLQYIFEGWSGTAMSSSGTVTLIMNEPKTINANYSTDLTPLVVPTILVAGIVGGIILSIARRRAEPKLATEVSSGETVRKHCDQCGMPVEEGWTHCTNCGKALGSEETVER